MILRYRTYLLSIIIFHMLIANTFAAATEEALYQEARESYYSLEKSAIKKKQRHNWIKVINKYEKVYKNFPDGKRGDEALFMAGKLFRELSPYSGQKLDIERSTKELAKLVKKYPKSSLADDAYFMVGENYEKLGNKSRAYANYKVIVDSYKNGDKINDARKKTSLLKGYASAPSKKTSKAKKINQVKKSNTIPKKRGIASVNDVRHWSNPNYTRIVIYLDKQSKYEATMLRRDPAIGKPPRLYLDFLGTRKNEKLKEEIPINDGLLKRARVAQHDKDTVRVVLDIESIKDYKIFPMLDPFRIIIDVRGDDVIKPPAIEALLPGDVKDKKNLKEALDEEALSLSKQLGLGIRKIVIDAGHGGRDPGAIGRSGTKEKDITLRIAKALKSKLEGDYGYQVILTRDRDRYLRLEERTAIANMENADLFVSIHVNANRNRKAYGMETYVMNARATNRFAAEVAARENAVTTNSMGEFGSILEEILVDMQKTNKVNESNKLASSIQGKMTGYMKKRYKRIKDLGVKKAPFYVLIGANMPSILIESGFISNKREEKRLKNTKYIESLSRAIALGISGYAKIVKTASNI